MKLALLTIAAVAACAAFVGGIMVWSPWEVTVRHQVVSVSDAFARDQEEAIRQVAYDPAQVRALYLPADVFADPARRAALIATAKAAGANALVIDVKDTRGVVMPEGLKDWVAEVRAAGLAPIARIVCFQDNEWAQQHPEYALKNADGSLWMHQGLAWLDPAVPQNAERVRDIALRAADLGFVEINLDYVRFPTDGNVNAIVYPQYVQDTPRTPVIAKALAAIRDGIKAKYPQEILSADLYAYSFLLPGDVGIGQQITTLGPSLDVISPMVYPSHYAAGNFGFTNPAAHPYEVTDHTLAAGIAMLDTLPAEQRPIVRPWIQAFSLGANYTPALVQASRQAVIDNTGRDSWMAWNANANYEPAGLVAAITAKPKPVPTATSTTSTTQVR